MKFLNDISASNLSNTNTGDQDLSGKQDLLVSGTNIKTVNGTSLLGSGNITTSGSGTVTSVAAGDGMNFTSITATGSVTMGTPSSLTTSTTNAVTATSHTHALSGVQAALTSGTNIKTVNSTTLLGSGNLAVGTVTSVAKGNGMNFTTFSTTGTVTLGTPTTLTNTTTNAVTSTSHTHAVTGLIPETCYLLVDISILNSTDNGTLSAANQQVNWVKQTGRLTVASSVASLPSGYVYEFELAPEIWNGSTNVVFDVRKTSDGTTSVLQTLAVSTTVTYSGAITCTPGYGVLDLTSGSTTNVGLYVSALSYSCSIGSKGGCIIRKYKKVTI